MDDRWAPAFANCFLAFMQPRTIEDYLRKHHPDPATLRWSGRKKLEDGT